MSSKMGHVESKTRSICQILEKPYVRSRGHISSPTIIALGRNVCLDEISDMFKNWSKTSQILEKRCVSSRGNIFSPIIMNSVRMFVLMKSRTSSKIGLVGSKTRSLGQILEILCNSYALEATFFVR